MPNVDPHTHPSLENIYLGSCFKDHIWTFLLLTYLIEEEDGTEGNISFMCPGFHDAFFSSFDKFIEHKIFSLAIVSFLGVISSQNFCSLSEILPCLCSSAGKMGLPKCAVTPPLPKSLHVTHILQKKSHF